jgi:hypothetical protein
MSGNLTGFIPVISYWLGVPGTQGPIFISCCNKRTLSRSPCVHHTSLPDRYYAYLTSRHLLSAIVDYPHLTSKLYHTLIHLCLYNYSIYI